MRLVESAHYADVALSVYIKVKALGRRPEGCTAGTRTLASYLGLSRSSVERGIAQLRRPGPDGVVELPVNQRRSLPGGCGTTARRRVRPMSGDERFVWLPVAVCEDLTPRQVRAYAVLRFAGLQGVPLTEGELAGHLRHHSGARASAPLSTAAAGRIVDSLEAAGWVTVRRRAGAQGRHCFIAHDSAAAPVSPEPSPSSDGCPPAVDSGEGSGAHPGEGSLANKEDHRTDRPDDESRPAVPAVGETPVVEGSRSREGSPSRKGARSPDGSRSRSERMSRRPYTGPPLTLHPRITEVLEPVRVLYERVNTFMQRRIAREVGRQLDLGHDTARLRHRLTLRFANVATDEIGDPARWLMGVALPRWGCGHHSCEAGVIWPSREPCGTCADNLAARRHTAHRHTGREHAGREHTGPVRPPVSSNAPGAVPRSSCRDCGCRILLAGPSLADELCRSCRESRSTPAAPPARASPAPCAGWRGQTCRRPAIAGRAVCVRHRAEQLRGQTTYPYPTDPYMPTPTPTPTPM
ncbi:hypothetical protein [Streptomyces sp. NPDC050504]|uniref:hypothetical protein n=1 Tax=Streptomyces sp. NPDC050504 TaxID=3365618 RepID=UPI0037ACFB8A